MKSKMKLSLKGLVFEIPSTCLKTTSYSGAPLETPYISIGRKEVASISKAYVKKKYPNLLVWATSEVFANGNSVSVYVCNPNGTDLEYSSKEWADISSFISSLSGGRYDGMHDNYEYNDGFHSDNGTKIDTYAKYVHCNNYAPHGSWPSAVKTLKGLVAGEYVFGPLSLEGALEKASKYGYTPETLNKAVACL